MRSLLFWARSCVQLVSKRSPDGMHVGLVSDAGKVYMEEKILSQSGRENAQERYG